MKGRQRGRNGGKPRMHHQGGGGGRNPNFDHNAGRMRGNAQQLMDKYLALARDASSQGDRVLAENYFQHADHYYRVLNARFEGQQNQQRRFNGPHQGGYEGQDGAVAYGEHDRIDIPPPAPSQSLIPNAVPMADPNQPVMTAQAPQPQPSFEQPYQPAPQPSYREPDSDIGLPPQLFGGQPQRDAAPAGNGEQQGDSHISRTNGDDRNQRPRHAGRRRFGNRRENQPQQAGPGGEGA